MRAITVSVFFVRFPSFGTHSLSGGLRMSISMLQASGAIISHAVRSAAPSRPCPSCLHAYTAPSLSRLPEAQSVFADNWRLAFCVVSSRCWSTAQTWFPACPSPRRLLISRLHLADIIDDMTSVLPALIVGPPISFCRILYLSQLRC